MDKDAKIRELEARIEILEKAENKRIIKRKIAIALKVLKWTIVIILLIIGYNYVNTKYIKPYKEKIDYVEDKIETVEGFVNGKLDIIQKLNPFS